MEQQKELAQRLWNEGVTLQEIGHMLGGISRQAVWYLVHPEYMAMGDIYGRRTKTEARWPKKTAFPAVATAASKRFRTQSDFAEACGLSLQTVRRAVIRGEDCSRNAWWAILRETGLTDEEARRTE